MARTALSITLGVIYRPCGRHRIDSAIIALQTVEAMDANRTGALVPRSDVGPGDLLRRVRGTLPVNRSSYNLFGEVRTASALDALL